MAPQVGGTAFSDGIESDIETNTEPIEVDDGADPYADWNPEDGNPSVEVGDDDDNDDGSQVGDEGDEPDEGDEGDEAPAASTFPEGWEWAEGVNPEHARKSWEKFTQSMQEVSQREQQLQPYIQLAEELQSNPQLQEYVRAFFNGEPMAPPVKDPALAAMEERQRMVETQLEVEREFKGLNAMVATEGLPPVDEDAVIQYALDHGIASMEQAYYGLNFRKVREAAREGAFKEVKKGQRAALPKVGGKGDQPKAPTTTKDIADMTAEEFEQNYGSIVQGLVG